jgi:DNA-binding CsgD family transcriptional regulator/tetratricopeptide (TPR) repeat protein
MLGTAVDAARGGNGSVHVLVGQAGVGKSRLATDIVRYAEDSGLMVLRGRAVDSRHSMIFRPLTEAIHTVMRDGELPGQDDGFGPALGRLLPGSQVAAADESLIAVAEGMLRLLRLLARERGCLLVLEDLHWADQETLAVLEYLADHCGGERFACIVTVRGERSCRALELASALDARGAARRVSVRRLSDEDVHAMVRACLAADEVPPEVHTFVAGRADGVPFFVEELLVGLVNSGALLRETAGWRAVSRLVSVVPLTVTASIRQRLDADSDVRDVLAAAAVLGRRFDWALLCDITEKPEDIVLAALRTGTESQLLDAGNDGFRFRHALTRDAVLDSLLPPEHIRLAAAAATKLQERHPELDGDRCELAASLYETAGDHERAGRLLVKAAERAVKRGALASAEAFLIRAGELGADTGAALLRVLALSGQTPRAFALGDVLLRGSSTRDEVAVRQALARAAISAGLWAKASEHVDRVRALATDEEAGAAASVLAAQVAMGEGRESDAGDLADRALGPAERLDLPEVACEALEILGRVVRAGDPVEAEDHFERALAIAERTGLDFWRLRALFELGTVDLLDNGRPDRLEAAREAAVRAGALATLAVIDLHIGDMLSVQGRDDEAIEAVTRCVELSKPLGLSTLPVGLGHLASYHASAGREDQAEVLLLEMRQIAPNAPEAQVGTPVVRALYALMQADDTAARKQFDEAAAAFARHPTAPFPYSGLWSLLCTVQDKRGVEARETVRASGTLGIRCVRAMLGYADAVALGSAGDAQAASKAFAEAETDIDGYYQPSMLKYTARRLAAQAALRDGWGNPVSWLGDALAWFEATGRDRSAAQCRALLKQAGAPVPRRRQHGPIPDRLRELGVTTREMEVLALVAEGLSNAEIGERLYISSRTVEKHVEKLLARTGTRTRGQLAVRAERMRMG